MKSLPFFLYITLLSSAFAQRQIILARDATGWAFTRSLDDDNQEIDPFSTDPDFGQTWLDQNFGSYVSPLTYDGPPFEANQQAPFFAGNVPGIQGGTPLDLPADANWRKGYFIKVIDGGDLGFKNLSGQLLARDAALVYLNGQLLTGTPNALLDFNGGIEVTEPGDGLTFLDLPFSSDPLQKRSLRPGPNLLAVAVARVPGESLDFGFEIELSGEPGTSPITFIEKSSGGWQVLHSLDDQGFGIDPKLSDPDFNSTWMTLGLDESIYNGPAFTPDQTAPFHVIDADSENSGTLLANPGAERSGAIYFVKEITGPDDGAMPLNFDITSVRPYRLYLNGRLFIDTLGLSREGSPWDLYWANNFRVLSKETTFLLPGKNVLAISFHPSNNDAAELDFDLALTGVTGMPDMLPLADPIIVGTSTHIEWATMRPSVTRLRFGPSRDDMRNAISSPDPAQFHSVAIPNPPLNQRFYYEILKPDGSSFDPPSINSFSYHEEFAVLQPTLTYPDLTRARLTWRTTRAATTRLRFGLDPLALDRLVENDTATTFHQTIIRDYVEGGLYTYEIVATDSTGRTTTSTGTFQIFPQIMRRPFLQKAAPTSMTVKWRSLAPAFTLLRFGQDPANLDQIVRGSSQLAPLVFPDGPNQQITDHIVTLDGLTPDTKYYYQIASNVSPAPVTDFNQYFTTPPLPGTPAKTRIWVIGDSGYAGRGVQSVKEAYLQYTADTPTDVWLMLGDNAYGSGTDSQYQVSVFETFPGLLKNTPVWPTVGNHDGYSMQYYGIFDLPTDGQSGGIPSGTEQYYSFDHGNIHFICLNSEETPAGMLEWLKNDLQATRADWIVAFFHHGPYTKGSHDSDIEPEHFPMRQSFLPILEDYGVDLILSGHSHQYERSHLVNGHYLRSNTYLAGKHAIDPGPGSPLGHTDRETGLFKYTQKFEPYRKPLAAPNAGQISATVGASSSVGSWSDTRGSNSRAITHPNPHPVHVATLRALGSMIVDVEGLSLKASYLDSDGQIRDQFEIKKVPEASPAISWWQNHFGPESYPYLADWFGDSDRDTYSNLAEFALGGDPLANDRLLEATITTAPLPNGEPASWFSVQYNLREGSQIRVEASQNLIEFTSSGIDTRRLTEPTAEGIARWESRVRVADQKKLFFQIKASR